MAHHSIEDYFPDGNIPNLRIKNTPVPPAEDARPDPTDVSAALEPVVELLDGKLIAVITGAGISTDSGLPDYRSPGAVDRHPMTLQQFMSDESYRRHYWARNHSGWLAPLRAQPNAGHLALAQMERDGIIDGVITQNVDMLHARAGTRSLVNLHGRFDRVMCTSCHRIFPRAALHKRLTELNPTWQISIDEGDVAPDADLDVGDTSGFVIANCPACGGILRTDVVFFGGTVRPPIVRAARTLVEKADALLVAGSSLAVGSAMRFVRQAHHEDKPIAIINRGATRGDRFAQVRVNIGTSTALPYLAERLHASAAPRQARPVFSR